MPVVPVRKSLFASDLKHKRLKAVFLGRERRNIIKADFCSFRAKSLIFEEVGGVIKVGSL